MNLFESNCSGTYLFVGEADVVLQRKSEPEVKNAPSVRFVVSTLCNEKGEQLAQWLTALECKRSQCTYIGQLVLLALVN